MWPGSNLPLVPITFEFVVNQNGTLGDLVDVNFQSLNEEQDRALAAMAEDAKAGRCGRLVQP
jgi:hypothetical protein